jgi:tetratricopeptide (TPR) repeat protein
VWQYLLLLVFPSSQSIVHDVRMIKSLADPVGLLALAGLLVIIVLAWRYRQQMPLLSFGTAWFLLLLAPSHLVPLAEPMAEHRCYLAGCGFFVVCGVLAVTGHRLWQRRRRLPALPAVALALLVLVLALLTVARNRVWDDPVTLWRDACEQAPNTWAPHYALADELRLRGRCPEAIPVYYRAIEILDDQVDAYINLGICLAETGQPEQARHTFEQVLALDPGYAKAYNNLALLALRRGDGDEAYRLLQQALNHDPGNLRARLILAGLFEQVNRPAEALRLCREVRDLAPGTPGVAECIERNRKRLQGTPAPSGGPQ